MTLARSLAFRYLQRETLVTTEATTHLEWLRECLEPHFHVRPANAGDWRVTFSADADAYRARASQGPAVGDAVPFFTLDSRLVTLPRWNAARDDGLVGFDDEFDVFYTVRADRGEVDVLAGDLRPWGRVALLRLVRELAMNEAVAAGGIFLHAAAVECDGVVYVIAGPKNAGKTTLLIHMLLGEGTRFVANDRVLLLHSASGCEVRGMPTLVNVRPKTREMFADRFDPHGLGPDSGCLNRGEHDAARCDPGTRRDEPLILSPRQFAQSLGALASAGGRLGAILFPEVSATHDGIALAGMTQAGARKHLAAALFPTVSGSSSPSALGAPTRSGSLAEAWLPGLVATATPMLRCSLGRRAYDRSATDVLDALREHMSA